MSLTAASTGTSVNDDSNNRIDNTNNNNHNNNNDNNNDTTTDTATTTTSSSSSSSSSSKEEIINKIYCNTICLAPMVRAGTLPTRLESLRYGADAVWGEEIIDHKITTCERIINNKLNTIDYISKNNKIFSTCSEERGKFVFQIGTGAPESALKAGQFLQRDITCLDINMGCPKKFSLQGGMGANLLMDMDRAASIVKNCATNLDIPVSCKIRLLETPEKTLHFVKAMEMAGACAITVHMRYRNEDTRKTKAQWDALKAIVDHVNIPIVANGDIYSYQDMMEVKRKSGCSSIMIARPALYNLSIFNHLKHNNKNNNLYHQLQEQQQQLEQQQQYQSSSPMIPLYNVIQNYLKTAITVDNHFSNTKYCIMEMMNMRRHPEYRKNNNKNFEESKRFFLPNFRLPNKLDIMQVSQIKNNQDLCQTFGIEDFYNSFDSNHLTTNQTTDRIYSDEYFYKSDNFLLSEKVKVKEKEEEEEEVDDTTTTNNDMNNDDNTSNINNKEKNRKREENNNETSKKLKEDR